MEREPGGDPARRGLVALTRAVPSSIAACELTHLARAPIDLERARRQHSAYESALEALGCVVSRLPEQPDLPDSVFVEDTAVVLPEIAVLGRPGAASRRAEVDSAADALRAFRPLARIESPATLDGGDVLAIGSRVFVGTGGRTSAEGAHQLAVLLAPFGYRVEPVPLTGCLHLKTGATLVGELTVLLNPAWVDRSRFVGCRTIEVDPAEPFAANAVPIGSWVLHPAAYPRTAERLQRHGVQVRPVEADELAKAEAGLSCCSLLVPF